MNSQIRPLLVILSKWRTFFLRGHGNWFAYVMSMINFVTISFYLLIENLTIIPEEWKRFRYYAVLFLFIYVPLATIVGYLDMKRGPYRVEQRLAREMSPLWQEVFDELDEIKEKQAEIIMLLKASEKAQGHI